MGSVHVITTCPWLQLPEACPAANHRSHVQCQFCDGTPAAPDLDPLLGACPHEHVLRSGQLPHW